MNKTIFTALLALLASANLQAQDTVTTSTAVPTSNLLISQAVGGSQYLVDAARDPGQGQTFALAADFTIEAITVQIGSDNRGAQGTAEDAAALSLNIYQVPSDPETGDPVLTLDSTTLLASISDSTAATFDASDAGTTPLYLTFALDSASTTTLGTLSANTLYAFTVTSSSATDPSFRIERSPDASDSFADGNGIFTGPTNVPTLRPTDDAVFFLQGTMSSAFETGDVNCDGDINFLDIGPFIEVLSTGTFEDKADIDRNTEVDFLDIGPFIALLSSQ